MPNSIRSSFDSTQFSKVRAGIHSAFHFTIPAPVLTAPSLNNSDCRVGRATRGRTKNCRIALHGKPLKKVVGIQRSCANRINPTYTTICHRFISVRHSKIASGFELDLIGQGQKVTKELPRCDNVVAAHENLPGEFSLNGSAANLRHLGHGYSADDKKSTTGESAGRGDVDCKNLLKMKKSG